MLEPMLELVASKYFEFLKKLSSQPRLVVGYPIRGYKRSHMGVNLTDDERVNIEKFAHPLHRKITRYTAINKFEISFKFGHIVWLKLPRLRLDH